MKTYTIKEFEQITKISAFTLRYFDKIGLLCPNRGENGYRLYTTPQIAVAEMILILQKANVPNKQIQLILEQYSQPETIDELKRYALALQEQIQIYQQTLGQLTSHVQTLERIRHARVHLNQPFVEWSSRQSVGVMDLETTDILDFFGEVGSCIGDRAWYLKSHYGFTLNLNEIQPGGYPLKRMFAYEPALVEQFPCTLSAGPYLKMYAEGSLENNPNVDWLVQYGRQQGMNLDSPVLIENVSGPVIETEKSKFIVQIAVPVIGAAE